jgi:hypothetical protein
MMPDTFDSVGTLIVTPAERKLHVEVDPGIVAFARSLIPLSVKLNRTRYDPHITLVRQEDVEPDKWVVAEHLHRRPVHFRYDPRVVPGEVYWWLRAWSEDLTHIRRNLGLPDLSWACRPPDGEDCYHITIGNLKGQR